MNVSVRQDLLAAGSGAGIGNSTVPKALKRWRAAVLCALVLAALLGAKGHAAAATLDVLVLLDDGQVEERARMARLDAGAPFQTEAMLQDKVRAYQATKQQFLARQVGIELLQDYSHLPMLHLRVASLAAATALQRDPLVAGVFENARVAPQLASTLPVIRQPQAAAAGFRGDDVTVAVLDTGANYAHPDFGACSAPGVPLSCRVVHAQDFGSDDGQLDDDGHGSNVAAIVAGVAPRARIAALDVFRATNGQSSDILAGINWTVANRFLYNIVAMNMSLGHVDANNNEIPYSSPCPNDVFAAGINSARAVGILTAVSAGNASFEGSLSGPACVPAAVSVGATNDFDVLAGFTNVAPFLDMFAPGVNVTAGGFTKSGTSMAAPHVAGAIAVLRAAFPQETTDETVARLLSSGRAVVDATSGQSFPRLDLFAATLPTPRRAAFAPQVLLPVGSGPYAIAAGDLNQDGVPDLATTNFTGNSLSLLLSNGSGALLAQAAVAAGPAPIGIELGDLNGDARLDIVHANYNGGDISVRLGTAAGGFVAAQDFPTGAVPYGLVLAHLNGDSRLDAVVANQDSNHIAVLLGNGTGGFAPPVTYPTVSTPLFLAHGDFNGDGRTDVAATNLFANKVSVWLGSGTGTLLARTDYATGSEPFDIATADFNHDGALDLVVSNSASADISILHGNGNGSFRTQVRLPAGTAPYRLETTDLNMDELPDVVVTNLGSNSIGVFLGNQFGSLQAQAAYPTASSPSGLAIADMDQDERPDIVVTSRDSAKAVILLNRSLANRVFGNSFENPP